MVEDDGECVIGDDDMVNIIVGEFIIIFFEVVKEEGLKGNELVRGGVKERECGSATGEMRVPDVFREF